MALAVIEGVIEAALRPYARVELTVEPTPLYALRRLSSDLGHAIYILREDLSGFALGGNKVRKLEYLIGDALAKKADVLLASGACSFSRNAAAAGKIVGLEMHLVLGGQESEHTPASRAFFKTLDTELHYGVAYSDLLARLTGEGRRVYELDPGGSNELGALGYVRVFGQIAAYSASAGVHFHRIIVPTGSTGTQVGLMLGQLMSRYDTQVIGMAVSQKSEVQRKRVLDLAVSAAAMLNMPFDESVLHIDDCALGDGYALSSEESRTAARRFAQREGIFLDPVYSAKAAAGLLHYASERLFEPDQNILFMHTGGNLGLFD